MCVRAAYVEISNLLKILKLYTEEWFYSHSSFCPCLPLHVYTEFGQKRMNEEFELLKKSKLIFSFFFQIVQLSFFFLKFSLISKLILGRLDIMRQNVLCHTVPLHSFPISSDLPATFQKSKLNKTSFDTLSKTIFSHSTVQYSKDYF